ncbi:ABC transporter ATP-binding protein, partial [Rothia sp. HMSC069C04]|uniref:ATP-binding cassette domain-containing protein n=1 Tax=Rothia sp. HMSC069C04 TaxID=1739383 RepID=UPI0008A24214
MKKLFSSILWSFRLAWKTCPTTLVSAALSLAVIACIPLSQSLLIGNTVSALSGSSGGTAWIYIVALALVVGINIIAQRWVISNMLILKSKVNYRVHCMLNNRLSTFPLSDIGSTKSQEDIRAAREAISKQELQVHTMSVMALVSAFAMVLLLCLNIANVSIVAAIFAALCSLPLAIAMVILAKRDYAIYTLMYEDYRAENYYLDNLMAQSRAQELHLMRASRFFSQRVASWRRRAAGRELSLESVRGIISIVAGLLCSVLLFASLYFLVDSGADISYVAGSLIGIIACVNATQEVGYSFGQIINGALSVQQFRRVCDSDTYDHASEIKTSNPNRENISKIICKDVSVQYEGASSFALKDINLELMNNQMIAVVGASGAGKTTLINAILGITPIAQGSITYKGASSESKYNMLANVGLVSQD